MRDTYKRNLLWHIIHIAQTVAPEEEIRFLDVVIVEKFSVNLVQKDG